jgi:hypothetical protein
MGTSVQVSQQFFEDDWSVVTSSWMMVKELILMSLMICLMDLALGGEWSSVNAHKHRQGNLFS